MPMKKIYKLTELDELPKLPCIYIIRCIPSNKVYIGQAINLYKRHKHHVWALRVNKHKNPYLQRAFTKYGIENFQIEIAECLYDYPMNLWAPKEQLWCDTLNAFIPEFGFNCNKYVDNPTRGKKHTEESKKLMSRNRRGIKRSEEANRIVAEKNRNRKITIEEINLRNNAIREYWGKNRTKFSLVSPDGLKIDFDGVKSTLEQYGFHATKLISGEKSVVAGWKLYTGPESLKPFDPYNDPSLNSSEKHYQKMIYTKIMKNRLK